MSGYLFDTCIVRNWFGGNSVVDREVSHLSGSSPLFISSVTIGEIEYSHLNPNATEPAKQAAFRKWMRDTFAVPELPITRDTAWEYAKFRRRLFTKFKRGGKSPEDCEDRLGQKLGIDENDLWLVAQACERNLVFVTHDHMNRIREVANSDVRILLWPDK